MFEIISIIIAIFVFVIIGFAFGFAFGRRPGPRIDYWADPDRKNRKDLPPNGWCS